MLSHQFTRPFQPDRIRHPRDFQPLAATFWQQPAIFVEIGAGKGKHALSFASDNANAHLIAIERTAEKYQAMQKMANQAKLSNLTTIHADAIAWVTHAVPAQSLSGVFILYPNPEPHNPNQRWLNMPFFEWLLSRLKPNGELIIASNIESYIDEAEHKAQTVWQVPVEKTQVPNHSERTHFEVKYLARGEACWQLTIKKPHGYTTRFDDFNLL